MGYIFLIKHVLMLFALSQCLLHIGSEEAACQGISADVDCQCDAYGRCIQGTVKIDPWLQFALETQRELQIDFPVGQMQIFEAHNSFNARSYGPVYGANDTCKWPPPYDDVCMSLANQEFSIVDMLNMGVRALELDNLWCADAMRLAHILSYAIWCGDFNLLLDDILSDIGKWLDQPGNENEFLKINFDEDDQGHDGDMNGALDRYLGSDRILSPSNLRDDYEGVWPTLRQMRRDGKRVVITSSADSTHQGKYIHVALCQNNKMKEFTNYPQCGGKDSTNCLRLYGDSTKYVFDVIYNGPAQVGVTTDLSEMVKCRVNSVALDVVTPQLMTTSVFTWAKGEPSEQLHQHTCVLLSHLDFRWYTPRDCSQSLSYACQSITDQDVWTVSESTGPYDVIHDVCPFGYKFSVPHNGYRQHKLTEKMKSGSVWLNYIPWITGIFPTPAPSVGEFTTSFSPTISKPPWTSYRLLFLQIILMMSVNRLVR